MRCGQLLELIRGKEGSLVRGCLVPRNRNPLRAARSGYKVLIGRLQQFVATVAITLLHLQGSPLQTRDGLGQTRRHVGLSLRASSWPEEHPWPGTGKVGSARGLMAQWGECVSPSSPSAGPPDTPSTLSSRVPSTCEFQMSR